MRIALSVGAAEAEAGGAVVHRPDRLGRREGADLEALVGIDVGGEEPGDLAGVGELAGDVVAHQLRHAVLALLIVEERLLAGGVPQRAVDVARRAGEVEAPLRHEGDRLALEQRDLLARRSSG